MTGIHFGNNNKKIIINVMHSILNVEDNKKYLNCLINEYRFRLVVQILHELDYMWIL